ncbi:MAG TPA: hypothetical protein VIW45_00720 [Vicinamibacterales bacterium]
MTRGVFGVCVLLCIIAATLACENLSPGPSLTNISLSPFGKQPTTDTKDATLCCCRATGTITNNNRVPVYVQMKLTALDLKGSAIEKVLYFVSDLGPGQTAPLDVAGFFVPCVSIGSFTPEISIKGLTEPPL